MGNPKGVRDQYMDAIIFSLKVLITLQYPTIEITSSIILYALLYCVAVTLLVKSLASPVAVRNQLLLDAFSYKMLAKCGAQLMRRCHQLQVGPLLRSKTVTNFDLARRMYSRTSCNSSSKDDDDKKVNNCGK